MRMGVTRWSATPFFRKQRIAVEELKDEDALVALDGSIVPVTRADADIEDYLPKAKDNVTQKRSAE